MCVSIYTHIYYYCLFLFFCYWWSNPRKDSSTIGQWPTSGSLLLIFFFLGGFSSGQHHYLGNPNHKFKGRFSFWKLKSLECVHTHIVTSVHTDKNMRETHRCVCMTNPSMYGGRDRQRVMATACDGLRWQGKSQMWSYWLTSVFLILISVRLWSPVVGVRWHLHPICLLLL